MLTEHQQGKFDEVIALLRSGEKRILLNGAAGVGKTYVVGEIAKHCRQDYSVNPSYNNGTVYATAPTNKALAVLKSKIDVPIEFKTIHSALKVRRFIDNKTGEIKFIPTYSAKNDPKDFGRSKVVFLDEASMVESKILNMTDKLNIPIIFVGDQFQLNPVGEYISPVFSRGFPTVTLEEIVRQGAGNPIIQLSRDIDLLYFKEPHLIDGKGYLFNDDVQFMQEQLAEVNGTDELKYLAYDNATVDYINKAVRERIYGANPKKVEPNETIVMDAPAAEYFTNQEVKVEQLEVVTSNIIIPRQETRFDPVTNEPTNRVDTLKMKYYLINEKIKVVHENSEGIFKDILSSIKYNCANQGWGYKGKFYFEEQFASIKYNHALTIHKSQGSTYKTTILNIGSTQFCNNIVEKVRLLYTGITRASDLIMLHKVP